MAARPDTKVLPRRRARWSRRPSRLLALLLSSLISGLVAAQILPPAPTALPVGGQVMVGSGQINRNGAQMVIDQRSARLGLDWQRFDIGSAASVEFRQPSASSIALNRVVGNDASAIYGRLSANGQVFLTNPSGVLFAPGAKVDVGALVASTLDLSQQDFAAGRLSLRDTGGSGTVVNQGRLAAAPGGYLALFGRQVDNDGEMTVRGGSVLLASGRAATVAISSSGLLSAVVTPGDAGSVVNRGLIDAPGSTVTMTARSAEGVAASLVNNRGIVRANSIVERQGEIWITGDDVATSGTLAADGGDARSGGTIRVVGDLARGSAAVAGTLSARAGSGGGDGGSIETSAARVAIADDTRVDTRAADGRHGNWTIDPSNFVVSAGGAAQTATGIGATTLATNLGTTSVTLATAAAGSEPGDIRVDAPVAWSANTTLTLNAAHDINLNAGITATGDSAGLVLTPGAGGSTYLNNGARVTLSGSAPTLKIAGASYTVVNDVNALQAIGTNSTTLGRNYALGSDIDASASAGWNAGAGFAPLGSDYYNAYRGRFEGFNHTISGLTINRRAEDYVGLFGALSSARVSNLQLVGGSVIGSTYVGALVGYALGSTAVDNVASSVPVTALRQDSYVYTGGLAGIWQASGNITGSSASGTVYSDSGYAAYSGGLVGYMDNGSIKGSSASGNVSGGVGSSSGYQGGLVGGFDGGSISDSSASGKVTGQSGSGGLVGQYNGTGPIANSSASGAVTAVNYAGGLVGYMGRGGITTSFASGAATATSSSGFAGGLAGYLYSYYSGAGIEDSFASGQVHGGYAGGLVGLMYTYYTTARIANSQASGDVSGNTYAGGLVGYFYDGSGANTGGIRSSHASGKVDGKYYVGGLVGTFQSYSPIADSYATGDVLATQPTGGSTSYVGGLVGQAYNYSGNSPAIVRSWSSGAVTADASAATYYYQSSWAGGLVGYLYGSNGVGVKAVEDAYSSSPVTVINTTGSSVAGGLVGYASASLNRSYATGAVSGSGSGARQLGGLVGQSASGATATASFWNTETSGRATSAIGSGITTAQAQQASTYAGWDVSAAGGGGHTWRIYEGQTAPLLAQFLTPLNLTLADLGKTYDGTLSLGDATIAGVANPERIFAAVASPDVGSYSLTPASLYSVQTGYDLNVSGSSTLTVSPRPLTLAGVVADKVYDGTRNATLIGAAQPAGLVAGEHLTVDLGAVTAAFDTKDAGNAKAVTLSGYTLADGAGGKASNYSLANTTTTSAAIAQAPLTVGGFSATSRAYDGSTAVAVSFAPAPGITGLFGSDNVTLAVGTLAGTLADKNVGQGKAVTVSGATLAGADAGNYRIDGLAGVSVDIAAKTLTVNGISASNKTYDGSTSISVASGSATLSGLVAGDVVALRSQSISGVTADRNVGLGKAVTVSGLALGGPDAANYAPTQGPVSVDIGPRAVTVYAYNSNNEVNKVYDGTTTAHATIYPNYNYDGSNLVVGVGAIDYNDRNAANGKTITVSGISLSGSAAGNYTLANTSTTTTGNITPKPLTVSGVTATDRVYDGTVNVAVNVGAAGIDTSAIVPGDSVAVALPGLGTVTGTVANKQVGNAKPVTVPGLSLTGADAANYSLGSAGGVTVDITAKPVTASYTGIDKVYDGTTSARVLTSTTDFVAGDDIRFYSNYYYGNGTSPYYYANYNGSGGKNVGSAKPVTISYDALLGGDAGNYALNSVVGSTTMAGITAKPITPVYNTMTKVYDGTATAGVSANASSSGIYYSDTVNFAQTSAFTGTGAKNVGTGKAIAVSAIAISGSDAANYTLSSTTASTTGSITPKPVGVTGVVAANRAYDGTTTVTLSAGTAGVDGLIAGDQVNVNLPAAGLASGTVASKVVGSHKPVTVNGLTLSGTDAGNYSFDGSGVSVDITQRPLTASYTGVAKVYNGGTAASVVASSSDIIAGDNLTFTQTASFVGSGAANVGSAKAVSVTSIALAGTDASNYALQNTTATTSADITPRPITVSYSGVNRVYNGVADVSATVVGSSPQVVAGDAVTFSQSARFSGDGSAGVSKPIDVSAIALGGTSAGNYQLNNSAAVTSATITPKPIGVSGFSAVDRVYDGTTVVAVNVGTPTVSLGDLIAGDSVTVNLPPSGVSSGTMQNKNVGSNKPVALTGLSLSGASAGNYALSNAGVSVDITPRSATATYAGIGKVYDGGISATVAATSADFLAIDAGTVGISATAAFSGSGAKNAGTAKPVDVTNAFLTGIDRDNYLLSNPTGSTAADITPKPLTPTYAGRSRVYDGTTAAPVTSNLAGIVGGDNVSVDQSAAFTGAGAKDVGANKPVAVSAIVLTGADKDNYQLNGTTATTTASVTRKPLTVQGLTGVTATDRVYDGTPTVAVTVASNGVITPSSNDIVAGDIVAIDVPPAGQTTGTMVVNGVPDKNVGAAKPVIVTGLSLSGTDAGNYSIVGASGVTVNITPKSLTATWTGTNKVYDGSTAASATGSSTDLVAGDSLIIAGSGSFTGLGAKNVGAAKPIDIVRASLAGTDAANYALANPSGSASADITPRSLVASYSGGSRVYDATTTAPVSASLGALIDGDQVDVSQTAVFTGAGAKNVGSNKPIQVSAIALSGSDAGNYSLAANSATTSGSVTPRPIRIDGLDGMTAANRAYDGTTVVTVTVTGSGTPTPHPGDILDVDVSLVVPAPGQTTGTMADKRVGMAKPVAVNGLSLTGTAAGNYTIVAAGGVTVDITPKPLTASYTGADRVYDGTVAASVGGSSLDIVAGDAVAIAGSGAFSGPGAKNVGSAKAIAVTSGSLSGADAANYALANPTGSASADITPRPLTATFTGGTRVYDGKLDAPVTANLAGLVGGDSVAVGQTAVFSSKNVGQDKPVAVSAIALDGADRDNYALQNTTATTTASVTPKPLTIQGLSGISATDRVYDGTRTVAVSIASSGGPTPGSDDIVAGDHVTILAPGGGQTTGTMADKLVGQNKSVVVTGFGLDGVDAPNYTIAGIGGVSVNISPRPLNAAYAGLSKVYDGNAAASVSGSSADIVAGDVVAITGTGVFTGGGARNVGSAKPIAVSQGHLAGGDASNYALVNTTGSASADITPRPVTPAYTGSSRIYDGGVTAPVAGTSTDFVAGDAVALTQTAVFTGPGAKDVGAAKPVAVSAIALAGSDAANYQLTVSTAAATGAVTPKPITVDGIAGVQAVDRVYDGTRVVTVNVNSAGAGALTSNDFIAGDQVAISGGINGQTTGTMADKNVGNAKAVALSGLVLTGTDAPNYSVGAIGGISVNITPALLSLSGLAALDRVYDGTRAVAIDTGAAVLGAPIGGDDVRLALSGVAGQVADKNAGQAKPVQASGIALAGSDAGNYRFDLPELRVNIAPRPLTASYTGVNRVYDGTTAATVGASLADLIAGDAVAIAASGSFADKNVGTAKPVTVSQGALAGADAANYALANPSGSASANIAPRPVAPVYAGGSRVYDGGIAAPVAGTSADFIAGDAIGLTQDAVFIGAGAKNAGSAKPVQVNAIALSGSDAANYVLNATTASTTASITPRPLAASYAGVDKVYDGTVAATVSGSSAGILGGDAVTIGASGSFVDKNVGSAKPIVVGNGALSGLDASNYALSNPTGSASADITQRLLKLQATVADRFYNGSALAQATLADDRVPGDQLSVGSSGATFADKNAGNAKSVTVSGIALAGADAGNYTLGVTTLTTQANILRAPATLTASDRAKTYGESLVFSGSEFSASGLVGGETITGATLASTGAPPAAAAGSYTITPTGAHGNGFDAANYELSYRNGQLLVSPRPLAVAANTIVRVVGDPAPLAPGFSTSVGGLVNGDRIASAEIALPDLEGAKGGWVYTLSPTGASFGSGSAANYSISYQSGLLVLLPQPPVIGQAAGSSDNSGGDKIFTIQVKDEDRVAALRALDTESAVAARPAPVTPDSRPVRKPAELPPVAGDAADGTTRRVSLSELLRQPLISLDGPLRRLVQGGE